MNTFKLSKLISIFEKKAQALPSDVQSTNSISSDETSAFLQHAEMTAKTAEEVFNWAERMVDPAVQTDQGQINTFTYSREMRDNSANFNNKAREFIESTDDNKSVSSIDSLFNSMMGAYNNLTGPEQLDDQWVAENQQFELAQDMKQMQGSMQYMEQYIQKQKNVETNTANEPQLP